MNESILFVDDEKQILDALKRTFISCGYNTFSAVSVDEALDIMENEKIDLVISDVRMPGRDGYQLLEEVKDKYPTTIRVVLSGYADEGIMVKMQRRSLAKRYLYKPWKNEDLIRIVGQIFRVEKILRSKNLLELINRIEYLPSPKNIYHRFNMLVEQDASMDKIAEIIESDQSVTAKILQVVNSSLYGIGTGSIRKAINYLGLENVKYIILSVTSIVNMGGKSNPRLENDVNNLWKHAVSTNQILSNFYYRLIGKKLPDMYSLVGLLHDIGKLVLMNNFTDRYLKASSAIKDNKDLFYYYERMEFTDITHEEIGAYLLNWWELPQPIVEAVLYHHNPFDDNVLDKELVSLLNIADIYSWNYICGEEYWSVDSNVFMLLKTNKDECDQIMSEMKINLNI